MSEPTSRSWQIFLEVYEHLPRQGPGDRASAARALALCPPLPTPCAAIDLGCGVGGQTLTLIELLPPGSTIVALDRHAPSIARLDRVVRARGLAARILPVVGDMAQPSFPPSTFDLVWSEGALYNVGIEAGLRVCRALLRPGGVVVFSDAVWRVDDPPPGVKASFEADYPAMGRVGDVLSAIARAGLSTVAHFTLPDEAWWTDFYAPMERRIAELRVKYAADAEALAILDGLGAEPEMHRRHAHTFAYEVFVARAPA